MKRTKRKKIEYKQAYFSTEFISMFDIKRMLEQPELDRISFSELEAERMRDSLKDSFSLKKRKKGDFFEDFQP